MAGTVLCVPGGRSACYNLSSRRCSAQESLSASINLDTQAETRGVQKCRKLTSPSTERIMRHQQSSISPTALLASNQKGSQNEFVNESENEYVYECEYAVGSVVERCQPGTVHR